MASKFSKEFVIYCVCLFKQENYLPENCFSVAKYVQIPSLLKAIKV